MTFTCTGNLLHQKCGSVVLCKLYCLELIQSAQVKSCLEKEVKYLKHVFITVNGFPPWVVSQVINHFENEVSTTQINQDVVNLEPLNVKQQNLFSLIRERKVSVQKT